MAYDTPYEDPEELQRKAQQEANGYNAPAPAAQPAAAPAVAPPAPVQSPYQQWTRQGVIDVLSKYGAPSQSSLQKAVAENPWLGTIVGGGSIRDTQQGGSGETWDVIGNLNDPTQQIHWQTLTGHTAAAKAKAGGNSGVGQAKAPVAAAPSNNTSTGLDPMGDALYQELLARSQQGLNTDPNNPIIKGQVDAYAAQQERAKRSYLADLAESQGPNANLLGEQRLASERLGENVGGFQAELIGREIEAERKEIQDALTQRQGMWSAEQERKLRERLAELDDATQRLGINTSAETTRRGQDLNWDSVLLNDNTSNNQFYSGLGFNQSEADRNYDLRYRGL